MDWARPSQPSPVTGPRQWPGWAKKKNRCTREAISRVHQQCEGNLITFALFKCYWTLKSKKGMAHLFLEMVKKAATLVWLLSFDCFPLFPPLCPLFLFFYFSVLEMKGLMFLSLIVFCLLWFWDEGQQTMVMLVVNNLWFSAFFFFLQGRRQWQGWFVTLLCLSLLLCVYIFLDLCFVFSAFFSMFFSLFLGWFFESFILGFLLLFIEIPQPLPLTSPAFTGLLFSTNEIVSERRGPRLDRIRCRFSACWIGMEKTNTVVPPATATFRQQWTFSFWPLIFGILTVGSQLIKNSFQFCHLD